MTIEGNLGGHPPYGLLRWDETTALSRTAGRPILGAQPRNEAMPRITQLIEREAFPAGTVIFRQGDTGHVAYYIEAGAVEISREVNGRPVVLDTVGAGRFFGEIALLDGGERVASAVAAEDTVCIPVTKDQLDSRIHNADPLLRILLQMLCSYIRSNAERIG
jgi:CRP-like cAMP-binding protein